MLADKVEVILKQPWTGSAMRGVAVAEPAFDTPKGHFDYEKRDPPGIDYTKGWPHYFL